MKTTLYIIRHGKTDWNEKGRIQGWTDIALSKSGRQEAREVAKELKSKKIHAIYSSPLKRAIDTAQEIARYHSVPVVKVDDLREGRFGVIEGLTWQEAHDKKLIGRSKEYHNRYYDKTEGGESIYDVYMRVSKATEAIVRSHKNEAVAIVSHGLAIKTLIHYANLVSITHLEKIHIQNAVPFTIEYHHTTKKYSLVDGEFTRF